MTHVAAYLAAGSLALRGERGRRRVSSTRGKWLVTYGYAYQYAGFQAVLCREVLPLDALDRKV